MPLSNYKITQITSNPTRELVGFYNNGRLFRFVSVIQDVSLSEDGLRIVLQSSGLPSFEFDVYAISDIDGTIWT